MDNKQLIIISYLFLLDMDQMALKKIHQITNDKLAYILLDWIDEFESTGYPEKTMKMCSDIKQYIQEKYGIDILIEDVKQNKDINQNIDHKLLNLKDKIEIIHEVIDEYWRDKSNFEWKVEILVKMQIIDSKKEFKELVETKMKMLDEMWKEFKKVKIKSNVETILEEDFMDFKAGETTREDINEWFFYKGFGILI